MTDSDVTQLPEYPGTPSDGGRVSDEDLFPPLVYGVVECVMMSGTKSLSLRYDAVASVGWLRHSIFRAWGDEFCLQHATQVVLLRGGNALANDCTKIALVMEGLDGPLGNIVNVLFVPRTPPVLPPWDRGIEVPMYV